MTLTASYQKVFSDNPRLGFFAQRDRFQDARDAGEILAPAKSAADMDAVIRNSTVDGVLCALFAILIVVVIVDAARIWFAMLSGRTAPVLHETPYEPSRLWAPSGLVPTAAERAHRSQLEREPSLVGGDDLRRRDGHANGSNGSTEDDR